MLFLPFPQLSSQSAPQTIIYIYIRTLNLIRKCHPLFNNMKVCHVQGVATTPFEVESEVSEDATAGQEGAAHACEQMPV